MEMLALRRNNDQVNLEPVTHYLRQAHRASKVATTRSTCKIQLAQYNAQQRQLQEHLAVQQRQLEQEQQQRKRRQEEEQRWQQQWGQEDWQNKPMPLE
jgi:hypothetical protein